MSEAEAVTAGGRVVGRYVLYDEIAAGGMATVHIGRLVGAVGFSRSVAIKRLHAQFARDPEFVAMFLEEARLASRIRHPNVVPVLDVESTATELFLVMEFIQGETLSRLTRVDRQRSRIVPMPIALAIAADMLAGLHAAHEAHDELGRPLEIVHRDISPHNVMVGNDGTSRVLDFGIAKATSSAQSTRDGEVKGKFAYMSPEQLSSAPVDRRADVFAASIVLWEMITGRRLFSADDPAGIVGRVLNERIQPPGERIGGLPPALDALVMRGLERDRQRRFSTAAEMGRALENVGVAMARPTEVAAWVKRIAGDTLKRRARRLAEIESTGSFAGPAAMVMAAPVSGASLPAREITGTGSVSESGLRPTRSGEQSAIAADASQQIAPPPRGRGGRLLLAILSMMVGAAGVFVWQAGGWQPARAKVSDWVKSVTEPSWKVTQASAAANAASAAASSAVATATAAPSGLEGGDLVFEYTPSGKPTAKLRTRVPQAGRPTRPSDPAPSDPKTNLPNGATGQSGDPSESTAGGPGQNSAQQNTKPPAIVLQRPSPGQVQVAIGHAMATVRACFSPGNPVSRAIVIFQSDGSVQGVSVSGYASGRPEEACVKSALSKASVDPFADPTYSVPVAIQP